MKGLIKQRGMSLIEVLAALAIIAIALMAVIQTTGFSTKQLARGQEVAYAHWVARNAGLRLQLSFEHTFGAGVWQGVETLRGRSFYWSAKSNQLPSTNILEIEVTVAATQGGPVLNRFVTYAPAQIQRQDHE